MNDLSNIFEEYKSKHIVLSLEEERDVISRYVYSTNKLEGNQLTLSQTKSIIEKGKISGSNLKTQDLLEQRGTYKALIRMINAVNNKENLTIELIKELNWLVIGSLFQDDSYLSYKQAGQKYGEFKIKNNLIEVTLKNKQIFQITPLSSPENVEINMKMILTRIKNSETNISEKASFLAQELWLNQPFIDGNKRIARLLINFLLMKEGYPLFTYEKKGALFNNQLVQQFVDKKPGLIENLIRLQLKNRMKELIDSRQINKISGYRFLI